MEAYRHHSNNLINLNRFSPIICCHNRLLYLEQPLGIFAVSPCNRKRPLQTPRACKRRDADVHIQTVAVFDLDLYI